MSALYSLAILRLATGTADFPRLAAPHATAEQRSKTCGSVVVADVCLDDDGRIAAVGYGVNACAVGQAAAALCAQSAEGRNAAELAERCVVLTAWLAGEGDVPDWPGIALLEPARAYPARHAAILLAWEAALVALA